MPCRLYLVGLLCLLVASPLRAQPLDLNQADQAAFDQLPGIGPAKAQAIIEHRAKHGPFTSVEALDAVPGIGPKLMERLRDLVSVSPASNKPDSKPALKPAGRTLEPAPRQEQPAAIISGQGKTRFFDAQGRPMRPPTRP
ncbi:ComEA family DNA-binding protein [Thermithiobacillus plumbiphilus]|uniref:ComEA family DNA-binding protein n=1 Tax=Thermithiobacillus plumbiphilus TaxID=1729899 RepID=A0ABU9D8V0_9PROT